MSEQIRRENLALFKHEAETPMRGHDPDGACCRTAITAAENDEKPAHPEG